MVLSIKMLTQLTETLPCLSWTRMKHSFMHSTAMMPRGPWPLHSIGPSLVSLGVFSCLTIDRFHVLFYLCFTNILYVWQQDCHKVTICADLSEANNIIKVCCYFYRAWRELNSECWGVGSCWTPGQWNISPGSFLLQQQCTIRGDIQTCAGNKLYWNLSEWRGREAREWEGKEIGGGRWGEA